MADLDGVASRYNFKGNLRIADYSNIRTSRRALPSSTNSAHGSSATSKNYTYNPWGPRVILPLNSESEDDESDEDDSMSILIVKR